MSRDSRERKSVEITTFCLLLYCEREKWWRLISIVFSCNYFVWLSKLTTRCKPPHKTLKHCLNTFLRNKCQPLWSNFSKRIIPSDQNKSSKFTIFYTFWIFKDPFWGKILSIQCSTFSSYSMLTYSCLDSKYFMSFVTECLYTSVNSWLDL